MLEYKISWLVEKRVLHVVIAGDYDLEASRQGIIEIKNFVDAGTAPVHVVWDMTGITKMPKNLREPVNELNVLRYHPNGGWIVMISNSVMMRFAGQIATLFLGANYRSIATYEEAVETISHIDPSVVDALHQTVPKVNK